jgi:hypothetical protein
MAPANVLHGAVRLQGFASSPTPETQVRVACGKASVEAANSRAANAARIGNGLPNARMIGLLAVDIAIVLRPPQAADRMPGRVSSPGGWIVPVALLQT